MKLETITPIKALNKAYSKQSISRKEIELFKDQLKKLFLRINEKESEENLKNIVSDFLKEVYYKDKFEINTKDRKDLVIHNDKSSSTPVAVIIETKKPGSPEMIRKDKPNNKALHELMLYYIVERFEHNNKEIKYLIASDIYNWYIFDALLFERFFAKHQNFVESYKKWKSGMLVDKTTQWFYKEIAKDHLYKNIDDITATYFNIKLYEKELEKINPEDEEKLADLYKILSPVHLLKQPFVNDSNNLNTEFYNELLHILGLEEDKQGGKKLIKRKNNGDEGSLLENTINILDVRGRIDKIQGVEKYGINDTEKIFNIALELCITWLNRVLFLKLLEGQLIKYNSNKDYAFLNSKKIKDFDALNELFFEVLAKQTQERKKSVKEIYNNIPYLNSSLFESTDLEDETIQISDLKDRLEIPIYNNTVIKDDKGKRVPGKKLTLHYLFEFLDSFDFASDSSERIQEQNKTIINASVLGLIFEKINGYKDGSYFTPGYITMYVCKESIRKAILQKFNEIYNWNCQHIDELYNKINDYKEANKIINSIKICDPAVGSGHFLVSALNEIIAVKSDLKILCDRKGRKLKEWKAIVENDELLIYNENSGEVFEYQKPKIKHSTDKQIIQEALFQEKQAIIENCLFGVDINPNSVKICRLRLWIELLKNAYYTSESGFTELETLPNIDINIKEGNSLVRRFDVRYTSFTGFNKTVFEIYKTNVKNYKNEKVRIKRIALKSAIEQTKEQFKRSYEDPYTDEDQKIQKLVVKLHELNTIGLFDEQNAKQKDKIKNLESQISRLKETLQIKRENLTKLLATAFEWRFEFPEILDSEGKFLGFDLVLGNPPYGASISNKEYLKYLYPRSSSGTIDTYKYFIDLSFDISAKTAIVNFITSDSYLDKKYFQDIRTIIVENSSIILNIKLGENVFDEVNLPTAILFCQKGNSSKQYIFKDISRSSKIEEKKLFLFDSSNYNILEEGNENTFTTKKSIINATGCEKLINLYDQVMGVKVYQIGKGKPKQTNFEIENDIFITTKKLDNLHYPYISHGIERYYYQQEAEFIKYGEWLAEPRAHKYFTNPKLIIREIINPRIFATYIDYPAVVKNIAAVIIEKNKKYSLKYLLALLNSKLFSYYVFEQNPKGSNKAYPSFSSELIKNIPVKKINKKEQLKFIGLVNKILKKKETNPSADISQYDYEIDRLVYELYGLTEEEIKVVEGK